MSTKEVKAVMHCTKKEPEKVIERGFSVYDTMYANPVDFPNPPVTAAILLKAVTDAATSQSLVKDGGKLEKAKRDNDIAALFAMLENKFLPYTNGLYKGDRFKLLLSGFPVSFDPNPHDIPDPRVILRIVPGKAPHSAKIYLAKSKSPLTSRKDRLIYYVYMTDDTGQETNMQLVLTETSMFRLEVGGLTRGKEYSFAVGCRNTAGGADLSGKVKFIAT